MEERRSDRIADKLFNLLSFALLIIVTGGLTFGIMYIGSLLISDIEWLNQISPKELRGLRLNLSILLSILLWIWAFKIEVFRFYLEKIPVIQSIRSEENQAGIKTAKWFFFPYISIKIALTLFDIVRDLFFS